jgi:hypothetical protein
MRSSFLIMGALLLAGCSRETPGESSEKVNPRLAKSGQQLADEPEIPVANDSSESIAAEGKKPVSQPAGKAQAVGSSGKATALTPAQLEALEQRALAGEVAAQLELGNAHFEGNGMPVNKRVAEYWWRLAAAQQNEVAADNLRLLYTKPEEGVSFFGTRTDGNRIVYLVDSSGSMGWGQRFQEEKDELIRSIRSLKPHINFTVIFYDDSPYFPQPLKMLPATKANVEAMAKWVAAMRLGMENRMIPALRNTLTLKPDTIFLLSDGMSDFDPAEVCASVRHLNAKAKARIHTISMHDLAGQRLMKQIAAENKGEYRHVAPKGNRRR